MQRPNGHARQRGGNGRNAGGNGAPPPPLHPQPPGDYRPEFLPQHPAPYAHFPPQTYQYNPYLQNANLQLQDPNLLLQQIASLIQFPNIVASTSNVENPQADNFPTSTPTLQQNPNPPVQNQAPTFPSQFQRQQRNPNPSRRESLEKIEVAVDQARRELIASSENVSTWKVIQSALVRLKAESWDSLGFQLQQVPSIHRLIVIEGKINAFIHCFVAVRSITSLYDLQVAICENEGIEKFEELELGPLVRHPLIEHYFLSKDMTEIHKITCEEIISHLKAYNLELKGKSIDGKSFLIFVANQRKIHNWEKMGLRIQSLGTHIGFIREALRRDNALMKTYFQKEKDSVNRGKKRPLFSLEKKQIDKRYNTITQRVASFSSAHKDFLGKHVRFSSSSSGDDDSHAGDNDDDEHDSQQMENDWNMQKEYPLSSKNRRSDKISSCPYPSQAEEMTRLGLREETHSSSLASRILKENDEPVKKKRKFENQSCSDKEKAYMIGTDLALSNESIRVFITTWKEACHQHTATEVFEKMFEYYCVSLRQKKKFKSLVRTIPFLGLLNVAVMSIKNGSWDSIYDTFQSFDELGCADTQSNKRVEYECLDVELGGNDPPCSTYHISDRGLRVTVEEIIRKVAEYFATESPLSRDGLSPAETITMVARKLLHCEVWLNQQFSVKNFDSLGYGEYLTFLERNISQLPKELHGNLNSQVHGLPFEVCLLEQQLDVLVSQASDNLWEGGTLSKHRIANLLSRQFPFINFNVVEKGCMHNS